MKEPNYPWEADFRRKAQEHDFGYDPDAWAAMEQLLEPAVPGTPAPPSGPTPGPVLTWASWKLGLFILVSAAGAWWLWRNSATSVEPNNWTSFELVAPEADPPSPEVVPAVKPPEAPPAVSRPVVRRRAVPAPAAVAPAPQTPKKIMPQPALPPERPRLTVPTPLPPFKKPTLTPVSVPAQPDIQSLKPPARKRKRDRRTLFPDVIENY